LASLFLLSVPLSKTCARDDTDGRAGEPAPLCLPRFGRQSWSNGEIVNSDSFSLLHLFARICIALITARRPSTGAMRCAQIPGTRRTNPRITDGTALTFPSHHAFHRANPLADQQTLGKG
jgi:hypothetical protein